jgi:hypothetical protein
MNSPNIQKIIDTIAEAFSVFDFSYLVSGIATFSLICFEASKHQFVDLSNFKSYWYVLLVPIGIYICGLLSWSIGKAIRSLYLGWSKRRGGYKQDAKNLILKTIGSIQVLEQPKEYKTCDRINLMDYISFIWTELTKHCNSDSTLVVQLRSIRREWVMEAVYEGLSFCSFLFCIVIVDVLFCDFKFNIWISVIVVALALIFAFILLSTLLYKATECGRAYARDLICTYITYVDKPIIVKDLII